MEERSCANFCACFKQEDALEEGEVDSASPSALSSNNPGTDIDTEEAADPSIPSDTSAAHKVPALDALSICVPV